MCLSIAIGRPDDVLAKGEHAGFEWMVIHNGGGYRCGYVRLPAGHPWYGKNNVENVSVHGGITFSEPDEACGKGGPDNAHWLGFDCAHLGDYPDPELPGATERKYSFPFSSFFGSMLEIADDACSAPRSVHPGVRDQAYVEAECRSLCEQAAAACSLVAV